MEPRKIPCGVGSKSEMQRNCGQEQGQENVKAVMFVPYTVGSELAKRMRQAESSLHDMTGYRIKIVERSGAKLEDILHKSDPWQGQDCGRDEV